MGSKACAAASAPVTVSGARYDAVMDELIAVRNRAWLAPLEAELSHGNVFAAVGALHLPGQDGLIEHLRARGWTVTRID